jgi:hypothetical protein
VPNMTVVLRLLRERVRIGGKLAITTGGRVSWSRRRRRSGIHIRQERPDLYKGFNPWDRICDPKSLGALFSGTSERGLCGSREDLASSYPDHSEHQSPLIANVSGRPVADSASVSFAGFICSGQGANALVSADLKSTSSSLQLPRGQIPGVEGGTTEVVRLQPGIAQADVFD